MADAKRGVEVCGQECLDSMPSLRRSGAARSVWFGYEAVLRWREREERRKERREERRGGTYS